MNWKEIIKGTQEIEEWAQGQICPKGQKWCKECKQCEPLDKWREHKHISLGRGHYRTTGEDTIGQPDE